MTAPASTLQRIWDAPTRLMHWLLAGSFAVAWLSSDSERWQTVHIVAGHVLAAVIVLRLIWGLAGSRHARFASFVRGPGAVWRYLKSLPTRRPEHHSGHNPAGGWAVLALLGLGATVAASGLVLWWVGESHTVEELHEAAAEGLLLLVGVHIAGVLVSSWLHRDNLVRGMVTGRKRAPAEDAIASSRPVAAATALALVAGVAALAQTQVPAGDAEGEALHAAHADHDHGDDEDDD